MIKIRGNNPALSGERRRKAALAWLLAGLTLLLMFGAILFALLARRADLPLEFASGARVVRLLGLVAAPIVGALIATRQPDNPYGWIWLVFTLAFAGVADFAESYVLYALFAKSGQMPLLELMVLLAAYGFLVGLALLPLILLLFPTGRLPGRRWRIIVWLTVLAALLAFATAWAAAGESPFLPVANPFALPGLAGELAVVLLDVGILTLFLMVVLSGVSLLVRLRRARGVERQQIKWFVFAATIWIASLIRQFWWELPGIWDGVEEALVLALLPLGIGVAILRYRLYDIDVIIRRTLVYTILTAILALVYFGSVVALQAAVVAATGERNPLVVVLSTLLIAALFNPLRGRVQEVIDQRFYRRKYDAEQTLATFAASARNEVELDALATELVRVLEDTMQPEHVSVWLRPTAANPAVDRRI